MRLALLQLYPSSSLVLHRSVQFLGHGSSVQSRFSCVDSHTPVLATLPKRSVVYFNFGSIPSSLSPILELLFCQFGVWR
jgi:hypothetical protein